MRSTIKQQQESLEAQASLWITKIDRGLSKAEQSQLNAWLKLDASHAVALCEMAKFWDSTESLANLSTMYSVEEIKDNQKKTLNTPLGPIRSAVAFLLICASLLLSMAYLYGSKHSVGQEAILSAQTIQTRVGEIIAVTLPDGSTLNVNTNSYINVAYTKTERTITILNGEINIKVKPDAQRPLMVIVQDKVMQALGTEFIVRLHDDKRIGLIVTEGTVTVAKRNPKTQSSSLITDHSKYQKIFAGNEVELLPNNKSFVSPISPEKVKEVLSWTTGHLTFSGQHLKDVTHELSRYNSVKFVYKNPVIKSIPIIGLFSSSDVDSVLDSLKDKFKITSEKGGNNVIYLDKKTL